jgi:hypothetical protein
MMFVLRSLFWLGLIFAIAPGGESDPRKEAGARAANAAFQSAAALAARLPEEAEKLCRKAPADCLAVATTGAGVIAAKPGPKSGKTPRREADAQAVKGAPKAQQRPSAARG